MGHPVDIFATPPPDSYICAICHDILKDPVSFKCGHTYCDGCARACLSSGTCPNCRTAVNDIIPSYILREVIGSMYVNCPNGNICNNGESVASGDCCNWSGKCQDLQTHDKTCEFKVITCTVNGCDHECRRKDMTKHLSGEGFLRHMELMKLSIETEHKKDMTKMWQKITSLHNELSAANQKINNLNDELSAANEKITDLELMRPVCYRLSVVGSGIAQINGEYQQCGYNDGLPMYFKNGLWEGNEKTFFLFRKKHSDNSRGWCISIVSDECK
jgi:hypothetical protein